ncbi:hypothetical protein GBAR_LOCUS31405 [Geodia barretti]|uniref:Uncharacterized protein n=1 Tax=Geodia barretti TaxID=519541 RepID=A0AA35XMY7_GEOBA|nr:hypothetical protein GBAR_LOCUS31405 [Geodia barretti]
MSIHKVATDHKIPIWWFILQRILEALAEKLNRKVLTKKECAHVSNILGFTEGELEAALSFLDKLNIFLYKKKILPDLIFTDAQVPLDKLSALVEKQYCLKVAEKAPAKAMDVATSGCKAFRDKGILTVEFLKEFKKHYVNGIFTANHFITLLEKLLIVSKLSNTKYFFPAILNCTRESQIIDCLTAASGISPLVVEFPTGWAPPGVFCCSVCHLQTQAGWEIKKPTKRDNTEASEETPVNYISRNSITFTKRGRLGSVTLIDNFSFFAVCVNVDIRKISGENLVRHCKAIKSEVFDAVKAGLRNTHHHADTSPEPAFVCPAHQNVVSSTELHVAHISDTMKYWICDEDTDISSDLSPRQTVWLGGPGPEVPQPQLVIQDRTQKADIGEVSLSSIPAETSERQESDSSNTKSSGKVSGNVAMGDLMKLSTSKGRRIRILERSAMKYRDIGTILLKDDTGAIVPSIQQTALGNPVEAVRMIYERWIQENEDHSWKKLAQCFRDVQLNPLARDIEQRFGFSSPARSQAHPSHQIIGNADESVSEDDTKRGASGLKRSAGSDTESPSSTRKQIRTSLSQGLETKSPTPRPIGTQSEMKDTGSERDTASLLQSEGGRKRKRVTQPPNEPTPKRCVSSTVEHPTRVTRSSASFKKK